MRIKEELGNLKNSDFYSLILFVLYKVKDIPDYAALSELVFLLDKDSLLKLCEYYGGLTITIPTIDELESIVKSLLMYQMIDIEGKSYEDALTVIGYDSSDRRKAKSDYLKVKDVMNNYSFKSRYDV